MFSENLRFTIGRPEEGNLQKVVGFNPSIWSLPWQPVLSFMMICKLKNFARQN